MPAEIYEKIINLSQKVFILRKEYDIINVQRFKGVKMPDSTYFKLLLLFVFDKMEVPLSEEIILDLCSNDNNWIPYMDCKSSIVQLLDAGFIYNINQGSGEPLYTITPDGRLCLAHFYARVPVSIRDTVTEFVKNNRINYKKKQEYVSDYYRNSDGSYTVVLKIMSNSTTPVLEMKVRIDERHSAKWVHKNWEDKARQVYETIYDLLIE